MDITLNFATISSGKTFELPESSSIIDSAELAGITLPHSCKNGRCNTCKCKITGPTKTLFDELGLSKHEKAMGWKLACARYATGNISLDILDLSDLNLARPKLLPTKIHSLEIMSKNVLKVKLRLSQKNNFEFIEGQHIDLIGPKGIRRSYSLASYCNSHLLELHVRRLDGGQMSNYLFGDAKVGDLLRIKGPYGTFTLRNTIGRNLAFLATGTGIAPFKAMLERISRLPESDRPKSISVFWGGRNLDELYWDPRSVLPDVNFIPVLSQPKDDWAGAQGYAQDVMIKNYTKIENLLVYACGSERMIHSAEKQWKDNNFDLTNFFTDAFVTSGIERGVV